MSKSSHKGAAGTKSPATPRWIEYPTAESTPEELLLYKAAGGRGERHLTCPIVAMAQRLAAKNRAIHKLVGADLDPDVADLLQEAAEDAEVVAEFMGRKMGGA